ncbi:alpha/beta fold hydrolase [Rhodococcus opacus]|nr:alpha/beta hydrolase [Rhodococcus opacus]ACL31230.1 4-(2-oxocyclohexyl)-2-hydroxy-buta-2,4-dienoic acid hydrolase [Rhodococcus sp. TFB]
MISHDMAEQRIPSGALESNTLLAGDPDAPALVLLHGSGPGAHAASNWAPIIPQLAKHFRVIAPDLVGFGKTELPASYPEHIMSWNGMRLEQVQGLLDTLDVSKAHILGNSMGGAVTLHLLAEAPDRFDRAALMGSIGAPITKAPQELIRLVNFYADPRLVTYRQLMHSFVYDPATFPGMDEIVQTRFAVATDPEVQEVQEVMFRSMRNGMESIVLPPSVLGALPHEVLIFHGRQDRVVPLETSLYLLQHLKRAELHVLDRCGHWAQLERWDAMQALLLRHLGIDD